MFNIVHYYHWLTVYKHFIQDQLKVANLRVKVQSFYIIPFREALIPSLLEIKRFLLALAAQRQLRISQIPNYLQIQKQSVIQNA